MTTPRAALSAPGRLLFDEQLHPFVGPCPINAEGECDRYLAEPHETCRAFVCSACGHRRPWCFGGGDDDRCDACWAGEVAS